MTILTVLRIAGNTVVLLGHWILFNKNKKLGLSLRIVGGLLALPFALENEYFDMLTLSVLFSIIDVREIVKIGFYKRRRN